MVMFQIERQSNLKQLLQRNKVTVIFIFYLFLFCLLLQNADADHAKYHEEITAKAVDESSLNTYLPENLGFGLKQEFRGPVGAFDIFFKTKEVQEWIAYGGFKEDRPAGIKRGMMHFYNPTYPFNDYARWLTDVPFSWLIVHMSAWERAKSHTDDHEPYSWGDALVYYYNALTSPTEEERNEYFAMTFRALGQVMHLLEDMGWPSHVRNDSHDPFYGKKGRYESLIDSLSEIIVEYTIPEPQVFSTFDHYFDSDVNDNVYGDGLAEYTNYNFLSRDTKFLESNDPNAHHHYFVHPNKNNIDYSTLDNIEPELVTAEDSIQEPVYYVHPNPPNTYAPKALVALGYFTEEFELKSLPASYWQKEAQIDDNVCQLYAQKLIPKVISYSAGLLNHFFRGELGVVVGTEEATGKLELTIKNKSDHIISGTLELYWDREEWDGGAQKYKIIRSPVGSPVEGASWNVEDLGIGNDLILNPAFTAPADVLAYMLVFNGTIGTDYGIIAKRFTPPTILQSDLNLLIDAYDERKKAVVPSYEYEYTCTGSGTSEDPYVWTTISGDFSKVNVGDTWTASNWTSLKSAIEGLIPYYWDMDNEQSWTKAELFNQIWGGDDWQYTSPPTLVVMPPEITDPLEHVEEISQCMEKLNAIVYSVSYEHMTYGFDPNYGVARSTAYGHYYGTIVSQCWNSPGSYSINRSFILFDTSSLPDDATLENVRFRLLADVGSYYETVDFDIGIYKYNWQDPITDVNMQANHSGALTALLDQIWMNTADIAEDVYYTSPPLDTSWINKTGSTKYTLANLRDIAGIPPSAYTGEMAELFGIQLIIQLNFLYP